MTTRPLTVTSLHDGAQDLILVRRALAGESAAIEQVLGRLACIVRFVFRLNRSQGYGLPTEALEDVVQQVYTAVWPRLKDYEGSAAIESWVFGFCRNCLRSEARRRAHSLRLVQPSGDATALAEADDRRGPQRALARHERLDALRDELEQLKPEERLVVELRHFENWSFERIAAQTGLPPSTVKDRCYRALLKMRGRLRRRDVGT